MRGGTTTRRSREPPLALATVAFAMSASACADLLRLDADGVCGNGIVEPRAGEDCDTHPEGDGTACGKKGSASACRYVCGAHNDGAHCPARWTCGLDGVCRFPDRIFDPSLDAVSYVMEDANALSVADLDGDGRSDLVSRHGDRLAIRYGTSDGTFRDLAEFALDLPVGKPATGRLDANLVDDVAIAQGLGVFTARGSSSRALASTPHPAFGSLTTSPIERIVSVRDAIGVAHTFHILRSQGRDLVLASSSGEESFSVMTQSSGALAREIAIGDIDPPGVGPEEEIALALEGDDTVRVVEAVCSRASDEPPCIAKIRATIATTDAIVRGTEFGDVDGDGDLDLFVSVASPTGEVTIAENREGSFRSAELDPRFPPRDGWPLEVFTLRLDGVTAPAFVDARSIFTWSGSDVPCVWPLIHGNGRCVLSFAEPESTWIEAVAGDFNADGRRDVAVIDGEFRGVSFRMGTGTPLFNPALVPTPSGVTRMLRVADFDGDLIDDLAFADDGEGVSVLFGDPQGAPTKFVEWDISTGSPR